MIIIFFADCSLLDLRIDPVNGYMSYNDNYCDDELNNYICNFDGGDCCKETDNLFQFDYCTDCSCVWPISLLNYKIITTPNTSITDIDYRHQIIEKGFFKNLLKHKCFFFNLSQDVILLEMVFVMMLQMMEGVILMVEIVAYQIKIQHIVNFAYAGQISLKVICNFDFIFINNLEDLL